MGVRDKGSRCEGTGTGGCRIAPPSAIGSAGYGIGNGSDDVATLVQADSCSSCGCGCGCLVEYYLMEMRTTRSGRDTRYVLGIKRRVFQADLIVLSSWLPLVPGSALPVDGGNRLQRGLCDISLQVATSPPDRKESQADGFGYCMRGISAEMRYKFSHLHISSTG